MTETDLTSALIYVTRPVVEIDGRRHAMVDQLLLSMEMREQEGGLSKLELRFANSAQHEGVGNDFAFEFTETDLLKLGATLLVKAGDADDAMEIFKGRISAIEFAAEEPGQPELTVFAEDALMTARMRRATKLYPAGPLRDIVKDVARALGLREVITGLNVSLDPQLQMNETPLAFLRRLLADYDADLQIVGNELHVSPRADVARGRITLALGSQLHRARACVDLAQQTTDVSLAGFDRSQGRAVTATSTASLGQPRGKTGAQFLSETLGEFHDHIGNRAVRDQAEAQALADAAFARRARRFVTLEGTAEGNPALRVGAEIAIEGLGPRFSNSYYVVKTCHRFDLTAGYAVDFRGECAFFGG